ncbi:Brp/Blh family beta-carotene 15,15'-dioxygenase [Halorussus gelatinilyticus]|uniref:Probable beta-carotene 15,15'-dioxygenase n=1 Tax=Halorussus gelatinilyticus TaxID=2937524 RepID=A0A8U0IDV6_9EURY|nr:Brp/Blh family beta-carotene 15,15'-dioxygenase [Halorussus gelatinilyticus]UPV98880.1 Brp/Blh family beta-carotene 15,15'-dioxygenase [Halorussus gelatinilyticus]
MVATDDGDSAAAESASRDGEGFSRALVRVAGAPAWTALALVALLFGVGLGADLPASVRYLPFLASLVVFGLPHGAADHLAVERLGGKRPLLSVGAAYLVGGGLYLAVWLVAPAVGFASFVALTWYHWGQGDCYVLLAVGDHLRTRGQRALAIAVRGGIPMVVPLVAFPEVYRSVADATLRLFDARPVAVGALDATVFDATALDAAFRPEARLAAGGGLAALSLGALALGAVRGGWTDRGWRADALETALLWAYFWVVPPILAVGLYFCLWHSVRHVLRLLTVAEDGEVGEAILARDGLGAELAGFARDALPNTVGALVVLGGLALVAPPEGGFLSLLALYLVLLAVLTLPHAAVVTWMDWREGVWSVEPAGTRTRD